MTQDLGRAARLALHRSMQIPVRLEAHPHLRKGFQEASQSKSSVGGDSTLGQNYLIQSIE